MQGESTLLPSGQPETFQSHSNLNPNPNSLDRLLPQRPITSRFGGQDPNTSNDIIIENEAGPLPRKVVNSFDLVDSQFKQS